MQSNVNDGFWVIQEHCETLPLSLTLLLRFTMLIRVWVKALYRKGKVSLWFPLYLPQMPPPPHKPPSRVNFQRHNLQSYNGQCNNERSKNPPIFRGDIGQYVVNVSQYQLPNP